MGAAFCIMLVITPRLQAVLLCCGWMEVCAASLAYGKSVVGVEVQHAATSSQQKGKAFASNDQHQCQPPEGGPFMAVAIDTSTCTGCALLQVLTLGSSTVFFMYEGRREVFHLSPARNQRCQYTW